MVMDIRRVTLSEYELTAALVSYQRVTPEFYPTGKIIDCKPTADGKILATLENDSQSPRRWEVTLKPSDALKPLIRFCLENNIMLPRNGQKSVSIADNRVALYVVLNLDVDLAGSLDPMRVTHLNAVTPADLPADTVRVIR
jgi:hypothetical protein